MIFPANARYPKAPKFLTQSTLLAALMLVAAPLAATDRPTLGVEATPKVLVLFLPIPACDCDYTKDASTSGIDLVIECPGAPAVVAATLNTSNYAPQPGECSSDCLQSSDTCTVSVDVAMTWNMAVSCRTQVWVKHPQQAPPGCELVLRGNDNIAATLQGQAECDPNESHPGSTGKFEVFSAAGCGAGNRIAYFYEGFTCKQCEK